MWRDFYDVEEELGRGRFGVVVQCVEKASRRRVAIKMISRQKPCREGDTSMREIEALQQASGHPRLLQLIHVFHTETETAFVLELIRGGELFDYLGQKDTFTEDEAVTFTRQLLDGLAYLHSKKVVHLDLKPENILLVEEGSVASIKVIDFGLARILKDNEDQYEAHGTVEFVAPEIVMRFPVSTATDMWAVGVLTYVLLSGMSPFLGDTDKETIYNIRSVSYHMEEDFAESEVSKEAKDFIQGLLVEDSRERMSADECESHHWLNPECFRVRRKSVIVTDRLRQFNARRKWHSAVQVVQASSFIRRLSLMRKLKSTLTDSQLLAHETEDSPGCISSSSSDVDADDLVPLIPGRHHRQPTVSCSSFSIQEDQHEPTEDSCFTGYLQESSHSPNEQFLFPERVRLTSADSGINLIPTTSHRGKRQRRRHSVSIHRCCQYLVYNEGSFDDWRHDQCDTEASCLWDRDDSKFSIKSKVGECVGVPNESECDKEDARRVPVWSRGLRRRKSDSCLN